MIEFNDYGRGFSTATGKPEAVSWITSHIPRNGGILDVGFGCAIYARLLRKQGYTNIDGVDVYENGVKELKLDKYYNNIFISNILDFNFDFYELIILGDVLEHLTLEDAQALLEGWIRKNKMNHLLVSIPFQLKQSSTHENHHEEHLQPEITLNYMKTHYPYLKQLYSAEMEEVPGKNIGIYTWRRTL
jgi:2-polyprenyl-3-methyl-5-hydroxy-6-metoxy-1,4-benzoquinol methylase